MHGEKTEGLSQPLKRRHIKEYSSLNEFNFFVFRRSRRNNNGGGGQGTRRRRDDDGEKRDDDH